MHSAEHLLNRTMVRMFRCGRSVSAHVEKKKSKCDYRFDRPLTDNEIEQIQRTVNGAIDADLPVTEEFLSRQEARERYDLGKVPDEAEGTIRIVSIGDYDTCPCIGPHVRSTREIGVFRITSSSFEHGRLRIRYKLDGSWE